MGHDDYIGNLGQWRTARYPAGADTVLTNYVEADLSATVKDKMIDVRPASEIIIKCFGLGSNNDTFDLNISGWMDHTKPKVGPGQLLAELVGLTLGSKNTTQRPVPDGAWTSAAWREVDGYGTVDDTTTVESTLFKVLTLDDKGFLVFHTCGYSKILFEFDNFSGTTQVGILWRPTATNKPILAGGS